MRWQLAARHAQRVRRRSRRALKRRCRCGVPRILCPRGFVADSNHENCTLSIPALSCRKPAGDQRLHFWQRTEPACARLGRPSSPATTGSRAKSPGRRRHPTRTWPWPDKQRHSGTAHATTRHGSLPNGGGRHQRLRLRRRRRTASRGAATRCWAAPRSGRARSSKRSLPIRFSTRARRNLPVVPLTPACSLGTARRRSGVAVRRVPAVLRPRHRGRHGRTHMWRRRRRRQRHSRRK
jgi:hypothetical protein